jgi:hypothetical protein
MPVCWYNSTIFPQWGELADEGHCNRKAVVTRLFVLIEETWIENRGVRVQGGRFSSFQDCGMSDLVILYSKAE